MNWRRARNRVEIPVGWAQGGLSGSPLREWSDLSRVSNSQQRPVLLSGFSVRENTIEFSDLLAFRTPAPTSGMPLTIPEELARGRGLLGDDNRTLIFCALGMPCSRPTIAAGHLVVIVLVASALNVWWIRINAAPPRMWDDAEYLAESTEIYLTLARGDVIEFLRVASRPARGGHPPMPKLLPLPAYILLGPGVNPALYAQAALIPVFCGFVFLLARRLYNSTAAVYAVLITCCFPLTYGLWRHLMAEFGTSVAAVVSQYYILAWATAERRNIAHAAAAGTAIGWGLLWKVSFPLFVVGPILYLLATRSLRPRDRGTVTELVVMAVCVCLVAGPFYLLRFRAVWDFLIWNSNANASLERFGLGPVFSVWTVTKYWTTLINLGTSSFMFVLALVLFARYVRTHGIQRPTAETWYLLCCAVPPLLVLSFHQLKEPRHAFPVFAMLGIAMGVMLKANLEAVRRSIQHAICAVAFTFPLYQFLYLSFSEVRGPVTDVRFGPLVFLFADRDGMSMKPIPTYAYPANKSQWPLREVADAITAMVGPTRTLPRVYVVGYVPFLDAAVINYGSILYHGRRLSYNYLFDRGLSTNWDIVVVLSGPKSYPSESRDPYLEKLLRAQQLPFVPAASIALPDGRYALLYKSAGQQALGSKTGMNLIEAKDDSRADLFPVGR